MSISRPYGSAKRSMRQLPESFAVITVIRAESRLMPLASRKSNTPVSSSKETTGPNPLSSPIDQGLGCPGMKRMTKGRLTSQAFPETFLLPRLVGRSRSEPITEEASGS